MKIFQGTTNPTNLANKEKRDRTTDFTDLRIKEKKSKNSSNP
ncbi:MAG: hypothetical protein QM644_19515 [Mobilitalea sp.]